MRVRQVVRLTVCVLLFACARGATYRVENLTPGASAEISLGSDESALVMLQDSADCSAASYLYDDTGLAKQAFLLTEDGALHVEPPGTPLLVLRKKKASAKELHVDLHFIVTSGTGFGAGAAQRNDGLRGVRRHADEILAQAGISIGDVRYSEIVSSDLPFLFFDCAGDQLSDRSARALLASLPKTSAIAVLLVGGIDVITNAPSPTYEVGGFSPVPGTGMDDGVVLLLDAFDTDASWGAALAHELGHYLGLEHTVEPDGSQRQALPDTDLGQDNLMHWNHQGTTLSEAQRDRIRKHPLVY